jgi:hypothetical protein
MGTPWNALWQRAVGLHESSWGLMAEQLICMVHSGQLGLRIEGAEQERAAGRGKWEQLPAAAAAHTWPRVLP